MDGGGKRGAEMAMANGQTGFVILRIQGLSWPALAAVSVFVVALFCSQIRKLIEVQGMPCSNKILNFDQLKIDFSLRRLSSSLGYRSPAASTHLPAKPTWISRGE
jgi:hypothetical protein